MKVIDIYLTCANVDVYPTIKIFNDTAWHTTRHTPVMVFEQSDIRSLPEWAIYGEVRQFMVHDDGSISVCLNKVESPD